MSQLVRVTHILEQLELELKQRSLWQMAPPTAEAMASTLPFCMDTLDFHQWLQFVLIVLIETAGGNTGHGIILRPEYGGLLPHHRRPSRLHARV